MTKKVTRVGAYGVALAENGVLLVHKGPNGCYRGLFDLPGGGIETGETPEEALRREFLEEVGMTFDKMHLLYNLSHTFEVEDEGLNYTFHQFGHIYVVHYVRPSPYYYPQDVFEWFEFAKLKKEQLTPFAWEIVRRLQEGELPHVFTCC